LGKKILLSAIYQKTYCPAHKMRKRKIKACKKIVTVTLGAGAAVDVRPTAGAVRNKGKYFKKNIKNEKK
jgi:hypothetical protein